MQHIFFTSKPEHVVTFWTLLTKVYSAASEINSKVLLGLNGDKKRIKGV